MTAMRLCVFARDMPYHAVCERVCTKNYYDDDDDNGGGGDDDDDDDIFILVHFSFTFSLSLFGTHSLTHTHR